MKNLEDLIDCIVIGGGAAGFFAALSHKEHHPKDRVLILEKSNKLLQKVLLSGGGRCNVTHDCSDNAILCQHYPRGYKSLRSLFEQFNCEDTQAWFKKAGVKLKTERDGRIFPQSNQAQSIKEALLKKTKQTKIKIWTQYSIAKLNKTKQGFEILSDQHSPLYCHKLILATGSSRSGYALAKQLNLQLISPIPSLFSFKIKDEPLLKLQGLSVQDTAITINKKTENGPLLITHWGLSGPAIIKASAWQAKWLCEEKYQADCKINWLNNYTHDQIHLRLTKAAQQNSKKKIFNKSPFLELPLRLWQYLCQKSKLNEDTLWQDIKHKSFQRLSETLQHQHLKIDGKGVFKDEFVTCGGVDLKSIHIKTMEVKNIPNLYIAGELTNADGLTGGFNFQLCWASGWIAGKSPIQK